MSNVHFFEASRRGKDGLHHLVTAGEGVMLLPRLGGGGGMRRQLLGSLAFLDVAWELCRVIKIRVSPAVSHECQQQGL